MIKAKEVMNPNVITIGKDEDLCEALRMMALNNITGLPETTRGRAEGMG